MVDRCDKNYVYMQYCLKSQNRIELLKVNDMSHSKLFNSLSEAH